MMLKYSNVLASTSEESFDQIRITTLNSSTFHRQKTSMTCGEGLVLLHLDFNSNLHCSNPAFYTQKPFKVSKIKGSPKIFNEYFVLMSDKDEILIEGFENLALTNKKKKVSYTVKNTKGKLVSCGNG